FSLVFLSSPTPSISTLSLHDALPISAVREIVRVPEITSVPSAPDLIEGVINLRGKIIPVMDLRKRFGQTEIHPDKKNRILGMNLDRKSTRLNSSHVKISYAVFCLKKK